VPEAFFRELLPGIEDSDELRASLLLFWALQQHRGVPRAVAHGDLRRTAEALRILDAQGLDHGLSLLIARGIFLCAVAAEGERYYLLNTAAERRALASKSCICGKSPCGCRFGSERNVFQLYEENVGPLTPMLAEELRDAEQHYPFAWLEDAFREAVALNRRNWRYIRRIPSDGLGRGVKQKNQPTQPHQKDAKPV
jgi:DnaD/phage-associated family protein